MARYTPEEARDIIRQYNEALASGVPISAQLARNMRNASVGIRDYSELLNQRLSELKGAFVNLAKNSIDGTQGLSGYSEATEASFNALGQWAEKIPVVGQAAKLLSIGVGKYFSAVEKQADVQFKAFQDLSRSGLVVGMGDTFKNLESAGYTMAEMGEFSNIVKENATVFATMGGTAADGLKGFVAVGQALTSSNLMTEFSNMGMSITDITNSQVNYIKFQQLTGSSKKQTTEELTTSTTRYIQKQDELAKITGLNADEQNKAVEKALRMEQFNSMQNRLQSKIDAGGPDAEEARAEKERNEDVIKMITGAGGGEDADSIGLLLAGSVNDPRYKKAAMAYPEMSRAIAAGEMDAGRLMNLATQDARRIATEQNDSATFGTFEGIFGSYSAKAQLAANSTKDYVQVAKDAKKAREAQKGGKVDDNTAEMAAIKNNFRDAAKSADYIINAGIGPATSALKVISGIKQQAAGVIGEAAGKEGQIGGGTTLIDKGKTTASSIVTAGKQSLASTATFGLSDNQRFVEYAKQQEAKNTASTKVVPLKKFDEGGYTGDSSITLPDDPPIVFEPAGETTTPSMTAPQLADKILSNKAVLKNIEVEKKPKDLGEGSINPLNKMGEDAKQFMNQQGALAQSGNFEKAMSSFPELSKLLSGISSDNSKVDLENDSKKTQNVLSGSQSGINPTQAKEIIEQHSVLAQSGNFGKSMGSYSEMANLTAKSSSDFDNMAKLAGNSTVMPPPIPDQTKQTIDSYGGLAQSGNFDKFIGSFSETAKYSNADTSTSTSSQNITATKPNNDKNTADMATAAAKKTLDSYGQLLQSGNFDSKFTPQKDIPSMATSGTSILGNSITSTVSGQYGKAMRAFPELTNLFAKTATSQTVFTNTNISTIKDQLTGQQLAQSDADKNLEFVNSRQQRIKGITDNLITKGITPTQKSFKVLSTLLELRIPSTGVAEAGGSGKMSGLSSLANRARSLFGGLTGGGASAGGGASGASAGGASAGGASAGGASTGGGSSSGGASGSSGAKSATGSSGASGSAGGVSSGTSSGSSVGNASNATQLNAGSTGSVAGGTAETEKAGGLAEGTGPTTVGQNQQLLLQAMNELGVTDPKIRASMAAAAEGESGFKMQSEIGYQNTSNENIRKSFGAGSIFGKMPDDELTKLKADPVKFFDYVYGDKNPAFKGYGNDQPGDGYKYRGRGFIGITFKNNYKTYGEKLGIDLVANPDLANDPKIAAKIAVMMMLDGMKRNPGADPYTQVARSIGNSNAVTEQRKKDAYARNLETGQFGSDKVADLSFMKKGGGAATQTAATTGPTQVAQADTQPTPVAPVDSSRSQGKLEQAEGGGVFAAGYKSELGEGPEANILLPDGKGIPVDLKQEESDEGDDSDILVSLQLQKIQVLGTITDAMAKGAELSRQLLQLQS